MKHYPLDIRRRRILASFSGLGATVVGGCLSDLRSPFSGPEAESVSVRWSIELDEKASVSPTIGEELAYTADRRNLYAFERSTGELRWRTRLDLPSTIRFVDEAVYANGSQLVAVDAITGERKWRAGDIEAGMYGPVVVGDRLYVSGPSGSWTSDPDVAVLDRATGDELETVDLPQAARSPVVPYEDSVLLATAQTPDTSNDRHGEGHIRRFDRSSFEQQWMRKLPPDPDLALDRESGEVFVGGRVDSLASLTVADGTVQWTTTVKGEVTRPTLDASHLYVGDMDGPLYAFDRDTGKQVWRFGSPGSFYSSSVDARPLVVAGDNVFAPNFDGTLYVVDRTSGALRWKFRADSRLVSAPVVTDETVFLTSEAGQMYAIEM